MNQQITRQREAHHKALEKLTGKPGLQVWRKLRRLEAEASRYTTAYCNGELRDGAMRAHILDIRAKAEAIIGRPVYLNTDPRGYALKLPEGSPDYGLHRDWGGYQILAPEIV